MAEDFRSVGQAVRNWGRWGSSDERGTLNLITPEKVAAAARLIRRGAVFELGIPFDSKGPQVGDDRVNPMRFMSETGADQVFPGGFQYADDYVFMALQSASQWDALAHVFYDGHLYNGFSSDLVGVHGAARCSIDKIANGVVGRGVLLDVARSKGVEWLDAGTVITPDDLDAAARRQDVTIETGDILLIRTGWWKMYLHTGDRRAFMETEPGLGIESARWLREHDVAAVCADNSAVEVMPEEHSSEILGVHMVLIRDMGLTLGELLDFEELAEDCASDGIYEFFFCGAPIKFTGAVGSPTNPLAIK
jgi:kynurenine formamidase